jgi:hypothetical protein
MREKIKSVTIPKNQKLNFFLIILLEICKIPKPKYQKKLKTQTQT